MKQKILLFSILSLFSLSLCAQVAKVNSEASRDLLLDLRITTALYRTGVEKIELNQDEITAIEDEEWIADVQAAGTEILRKQKVSEAEIKNVDWSKVARKTGGFFSNIYKKFRTSSRLNGVDVGVVLLVSNAFENLIPVFLVGAGQPGLAAVSVFLPTGEALTAGYALFKKFLKQRKIRKMYGDKELYQFHRDLDEKVTDYLHLSKDETLLIPTRVVDGKVVLIAVNKNHLIGKHKLTFAKAKKYAEKHGVQDDDYKSLRKISDTKLAKFIVLIEQFYATQSSEWLSQFEKQFSDSIIVTDNLEPTKELRVWAHQINQVSNCDGLRILIQDVPKNHASRDIIVLVKDVLFPTLAENVKGWKTGMFKKLRKGLDKIEVQINLEKNPVWDLNQAQRIDQLFENTCR